MKTSHDTDMAQKLLSAIADSIHTSDCIRLLIAEGVLGLDDLQLMRDIIVLSKAERSAARDAAALMVPLLLAEREGSLCYTLEQKRIEDLCMRALRLRADADDSAETDEDTDENDGNTKLSEAALRAAASSFAEEAIQSAGRALAQNASPLIAYVRGAESRMRMSFRTERRARSEASEDAERGDQRGSESAHEPLSPIVVYAPLDGSAQAPKVYWQRYFSAERALERAFQARAKNAADSPSGENAASAMPPASGNADAASRGAPQKMAACALRAGAFQDMELNEEQKRALSCALRAKTLIISGGPGTGKTTTVAAILRALFAAGLCNASTVLLAAPTGRAAQRMQDALVLQSRRMRDLEITERDFFASLSASTLHRLLEYANGVFRRTPSYPLKADVLIVDEVSMVDAELMCSLLAALPASCRLILIGDRDQLPSVSLGAVFSSILPAPNQHPGEPVPARGCGEDSREGISIVTLERNNRSVQEIGRAALACRQGSAEEFLRLAQEVTLEEFRQRLCENALTRISPPDGFQHRALALTKIIQAWLEHSLTDTVKSDDYFTILGRVLASSSSEEAQPLLVRLLDLLDTTRILVFTRRFITGLEFCNKAACSWLLLRLKSMMLDSHSLSRADGRVFINGMPVIVTANDHARALWNGDQGVYINGRVWFRNSCFHDSPPGAGENELLRSFNLSDLHNIEPAFAITVHKSQGSECDRVLVIFPEQTSSRLLACQIVYTAITRAKYEVLLYGDDEVIKTALTRSIERESGLTLTPL